MTISHRYLLMARVCLYALVTTALPACGELQSLASDNLDSIEVDTQRQQDEVVKSTPMSSNDTQLTTQPAQTAGHLRLKDNLDRPQDGYCLDILGSGDYIRFDMPMSAHNCKPGLYADEAVVFETNGQIRFPAYEVCATVAGINNTVLAGTAVMPKGCGERSPFLESQYLQHFVHRDDGRIELQGSGLCITVGQESASTFDASHRWRALFMAHCEQAPLPHSQWHFVVPIQ